MKLMLTRQTLKLLTLLFLSALLVGCQSETSVLATFVDDYPSLSPEEQAEWTTLLRNNQIAGIDRGELIDKLHKHALGAAYYSSYMLNTNKPEEFRLALELLASEIYPYRAYRVYAALRFCVVLQAADTSFDALSPASQKIVLDTTKRLEKTLTTTNDKKQSTLQLAYAYLLFYRNNELKSFSILQDINEESLLNNSDAVKLYHQLYTFLILKLQKESAPADAFFFSTLPNRQTSAVFTFINQTDPDLLRTTAYNSFYQAIWLYSRRSYSASATQFGRSLASDNFSQLVAEYPMLVVTMARALSLAYKGAGLSALEQQALEALAAQKMVASKKVLPYLDMASATILQRSEAEKALVFYQKALPLATDDRLNNELIASYFNFIKALYSNHDTEAMVQNMVDMARYWHNSQVLDAFFEDFINDLMAKQDFDLVCELYDKLIQFHGSSDIRAQYGWVVSRLLASKLTSYHFTTKNIERRIAADIEDNPHSFYNFVYATMHNQVPRVLQNLTNDVVAYDFNYPPIDKTAPLTSASAYFENYAYGPSPISRELHDLGFLYYNFLAFRKNQTIASIYADRPLMTTSGLRLMARALYEDERWLYAYAVMSYARFRPDFVPNRNDYTILYPKAYADEISQVATKMDINEHILTGLIRQESGFTYDIVSRANAIGLTQVLPSTARDMNYRLKFKSYDIKDPETNLMFGTSYLRWLNSKLTRNSFAFMLLGYNGGYGNARKWINRWPDLPEEIILEAIPFKESRNYVKIITTSAITYNFLYGNEEGPELLKLIFPNLVVYP